MKQYTIVLVSLDPTLGSEMKKTRLCIVISPDEMNDCLRTLLVAPLTTNINTYPWRVPIDFQRKKGMIALDQIRTIDKQRVIRRLGSARPKVVSAVTAVLDEMLVQRR